MFPKEGAKSPVNATMSEKLSFKLPEKPTTLMKSQFESAEKLSATQLTENFTKSDNVTLFTASPRLKPCNQLTLQTNNNDELLTLRQSPRKKMAPAVADHAESVTKSVGNEGKSNNNFVSFSLEKMLPNSSLLLRSRNKAKQRFTDSLHEAVAHAERSSAAFPIRSTSTPANKGKCFGQEYDVYAIPDDDDNDNDNSNLSLRQRTTLKSNLVDKSVPSVRRKSARCPAESAFAGLKGSDTTVFPVACVVDNRKKMITEYDRKSTVRKRNSSEISSTSSKRKTSAAISGESPARSSKRLKTLGEPFLSQSPSRNLRARQSTISSECVSLTDKVEGTGSASNTEVYCMSVSDSVSTTDCREVIIVSDLSIRDREVITVVDDMKCCETPTASPACKRLSISTAKELTENQKSATLHICHQMSPDLPGNGRRRSLRKRTACNGCTCESQESAKAAKKGGR